MSYVSIRASLQQRGEPIGDDGVGTYRMFQSAPHFSSEANAFRTFGLLLSHGFNPRLTSAARRTLPTIAEQILYRRFNPRLTSAARRTCHAVSFCVPLYAFQSAPHFSSEANSFNNSRYAPPTRFQSAPHFSSEANFRMSDGTIANTKVSIRASLQQRGELNIHGVRDVVFLFQSAPHFSSEANPILPTK